MFPPSQTNLKTISPWIRRIQFFLRDPFFHDKEVIICTHWINFFYLDWASQRFVADHRSQYLRDTYRNSSQLDSRRSTAQRSPSSCWGKEAMLDGSHVGYPPMKLFVNHWIPQETSVLWTVHVQGCCTYLVQPKQADASPRGCDGRDS
jgi:hypothetical protein